MKRYLEEIVREDLERKMVILGGPRQVGKTTLSLSLLGNALEDHPAYLNWDYIDDRKQLAEGKIPGDETLVVLDEIHKFRGWRNLVKGLYGKDKSKVKFLFMGSA